MDDFEGRRLAARLARHTDPLALALIEDDSLAVMQLLTDTAHPPDLTETLMTLEVRRAPRRCIDDLVLALAAALEEAQLELQAIYDTAPESRDRRQSHR